mmetsp:Transcript_3835/g.5813  ORF Transcript_3835/g.5813 Transcript_3835/m.5813 type:complete len:223 (-) Transcript_3835:1318-1986(-)
MRGTSATWFSVLGSLRMLVSTLAILDLALARMTEVSDLPLYSNRVATPASPGALHRRRGVLCFESTSSPASWLAVWVRSRTCSSNLCRRSASRCSSPSLKYTTLGRRRATLAAKTLSSSTAEILSAIPMRNVPADEALSAVEAVSTTMGLSSPKFILPSAARWVLRSTCPLALAMYTRCCRLRFRSSRFSEGCRGLSRHAHMLYGSVRKRSRTWKLGSSART